MRRSAFALVVAAMRDRSDSPRRPSDPPDIKLVVLVVLGAIGLALLAVGVVTAAGWSLIVPGCVALLVSLSGAWLIQRSRDRTLR
jgi:CHASE2 domain-containing sensor protein